MVAGLEFGSGKMFEVSRFEPAYGALEGNVPNADHGKRAFAKLPPGIGAPLYATPPGPTNVELPGVVRILPPRKFRINFGSTGAIKPSASMSSMTVTKMNAMAAGRAFIGNGA